MSVAFPILTTSFSRAIGALDARESNVLGEVFRLLRNIFAWNSKNTESGLCIHQGSLACQVQELASFKNQILSSSVSAVLWGTDLLWGLGTGCQTCTWNVVVWLEGLDWQACKELALVLEGAVLLPLLLLRACPTLGLPTALVASLEVYLPCAFPFFQLALAVVSLKQRQGRCLDSKKLPLLHRSMQNLVLKTNGHLCMHWPGRGWRFLFTRLELCRGSFPPAFGSWGSAEPWMHRASSKINPDPTEWFIPHKLPGAGTCGEAPSAHRREVWCVSRLLVWMQKYMERFIWKQKTAHRKSKLSWVSQLCTGMLDNLQTNCTQALCHAPSVCPSWIVWASQPHLPEKCLKQSPWQMLNVMSTAFLPQPKAVGSQAGTAVNLLWRIQSLWMCVCVGCSWALAVLIGPKRFGEAVLIFHLNPRAEQSLKNGREGDKISQNQYEYTVCLSLSAPWRNGYVERKGWWGIDDGAFSFPLYGAVSVCSETALKWELGYKKKHPYGSLSFQLSDDGSTS